LFVVIEMLRVYICVLDNYPFLITGFKIMNYCIVRFNRPCTHIYKIGVA
jgi:hypothetical protein